MSQFKIVYSYTELNGATYQKTESNYRFIDESTHFKAFQEFKKMWNGRAIKAKVEVHEIIPVGIDSDNDTYHPKNPIFVSK